MDTFKLPQCIGFNDIHRSIRWLHIGIWHSGLQENMHTVCDVPLLRSSPS